VGASPFGGCAVEPCYGLSPSGLIDDANDDPIGFSHEMFALGPEVSSAFETRPFVLSWDLDYCISDDGQTCSGVQNIEANGNGHLRFGVIMLAQ
jgi:hypothetical protein